MPSVSYSTGGLTCRKRLSYLKQPCIAFPPNISRKAENICPLPTLSKPPAEHVDKIKAFKISRMARINRDVERCGLSPPWGISHIMVRLCGEKRWAEGKANCTRYMTVSSQLDSPYIYVHIYTYTCLYIHIFLTVLYFQTGQKTQRWLEKEPSFIRKTSTHIRIHWTLAAL